MASEDGSRPAFSWNLTVRFGGVFPAGGVVASVPNCYTWGEPAHRTTHFELYVMPDGFARDTLDPGNIFVPFEGEAKLDHATATAGLEPSEGGTPSVTVSVTGGDEPGRTLHHLRVDDAFVWADRRATIVRVVPPESGTLGATGWIEVSLSNDASSRSAPHSVAGGHRHAG